MPSLTFLTDCYYEFKEALSDVAKEEDYYYDEETKSDNEQQGVQEDKDKKEDKIQKDEVRKRKSS